MSKVHARFALQTTLIYAIVAAAWIAWSDRVLAALVHDPVLQRDLATLKGWGFVAVTAALLYALIRRGARQQQREIDARAATEANVRVWADAFENCAHGISLGDAENRHIIACNPAYARLHGYTVAEMVGMPIRSRYDPSDHTTLERHFAEASRMGKVSFEAHSRRKDGTWFEAQVDLIAVRHSDGTPLYYVATKCDITDQKRAVAALRESEERFRAVVENIHEIFWMITGDGSRVLYISPSYETIWGRSCASLYQSPGSWLDAVHAEDRLRVAETMAERLRLGTYDEQYRVVRPDGSERWVRDHAFPIKTADGRIERIVGVAEDITERKKLEAQFLRAQRMEAIGMLAGGVAHDLNNILAPTLMAAGLLKENVTDDHDREMLTMIEGSARRGADIVRQLLTFSRGAEGARAPVQIRHLLKEMASIVRETFPREITLVEENARELWPVVADATQIHQVVVNLCVNARDAMPYGGRLTLRTENVTLTRGDLLLRPESKPGAYVGITVADTGSGMSPEVLDRIFEPFFTTKGPEKGTGLGLSTVQKIVRGHDGFITVTSELGRGSAFQIFLPAAPQELAPPSTAAETPFPKGCGECILVVDDEEPIRAAMRTALEQHNYKVLTAANGKEAITIFLGNRDQVRLVVTDDMMPEMGGIALMRALRLLDPHIRLIVASGLGPEGRHKEIGEIGVQMVLPKPSGHKALLDAVQRVLQQARG